MGDIENFNAQLKKAEKGDSIAQCSVGYYYETGKGVDKNIKEAVKWYEKSASQGNATAQYNLGLCYFHGRGVSQDYKTAVKYYETSANQGYKNAQNNLGWCYQKGYGVKSSERKAIKWYKKAAEQGHEKATQNLKNLNVDTTDIEKVVGGNLAVKILSVIWIVLSIGFLAYSLISGFSYFKTLKDIRSDFLAYVIKGGILHVFFFIMSLWGVSQLITIPEILKGQRTTKTDKKIYLFFGVVFLITIVVSLISGASNGLNYVGLISALVIEVIVMILTLASASAIVYFSYYGSEIIILVNVFFFFLCSYLNASGRGFLSFLAGIPVVLCLVSPIIAIFVNIFDKNPGYSSNTSNGNNEYSKGTSNSDVNEQSKNVEIKQDLKYYHYKTEVKATPCGEPEKTSISGLYSQPYDVDCTFYFKNAQGKEKVEKASYKVSETPPYRPTAKDAEYRFAYKLGPKD